ncbi:MAG: T9SS type A sorting domain-containing protein [Dinghuibacter sp.]|nr:T9SS type A sorting domain-containing protein [Dinghuibacter sp.]
MASSVPENSVAFSPNVTRTNTDVKRVLVGAGAPLCYVTAWDGGNAGIHYNIPASAISGTLALPLGAVHPDVVVSSTNTGANQFILCVYRLGTNLQYSFYKWTGAGFALSVTGVLTAIGAGTSPVSVNIDADDNGNYAIVANRANASIAVWENTNASLPGAPVLRHSLGAGAGVQTDICLNNKWPGGGVTTNVHISYTNTTNTILFTRAATYGIAAAFGAAIVVAPAVAGVTYIDPRIACPNADPPLAACNATDVFSIIYDRISAANYIITLYSARCPGAATTTPLTTAIPGFPVPAIAFNKRPALSYNRKFSYSSGASPNDGAITAAWNAENPGRSVVGQKLRADGTIWSPGGYVFYYDIPNPTRTSCDLVSVSAKYSDDRVYISFYDYSSQKVIVKEFTYGVNSMRTAGTQSWDELVAAGKPGVNIYPNPARGDIRLQWNAVPLSERVQLTVTDISGKTVLSLNNTAGQLQQQAQNWFNTARSGMYLFTFNSANGWGNTVKLVKE